MNKYRETKEGKIKRTEYRKKNYAQTRKNNFNSKLIYNNYEDMMIMNHEISDRELSKKIGRSVQAIQIRRHRLLNNK